MDNIESIALIEDGLEGKWALQYDTPTQYLHFIKPLNNDERGIVIIANSPDFIENRQQLEYDIIATRENNVFMNFIVNTSKQVIQYKIHFLNSHMPSLQLDAPDGKYFHYEKMQDQ